MGGTKHDDGKLRFDLIPASAEIALAKALTHGATKYAPNNWRMGFDWMRTYGALRRHLNAWVDPRQSDLDADSGLPHLDLAFCNLAFLIEFRESKPQLDDRPHTVDENE